MKIVKSKNELIIRCKECGCIYVASMNDFKSLVQNCLYRVDCPDCKNIQTVKMKEICQGHLDEEIEHEAI